MLRAKGTTTGIVKLYSLKPHWQSVVRECENVMGI